MPAQARLGAVVRQLRPAPAAALPDRTIVSTLNATPEQLVEGMSVPSFAASIEIDGAPVSARTIS